MEEFLNSVGITEKGTISDDNCYVIDLSESSWAKAYSKLDKSNQVEEDEDSSQMTEETASIQFISDNYTITLLDDGENYTLVCREN